MDVLIAGAGPAGLALARECARRGLTTALVDPAPRRHWPPTYGLWADEVPALPATAVAAAPASALAYGTTAHRLSRSYLVLTNRGLRAWLTDDRVEVLTGRVERVDHGGHGATVRLADGRRLAAGVVVDASGERRVLTGGALGTPRAEQTAFGLVLPAAVADALVPDSATTAVFMDWRAAAAEPSFLYAIPVGGGEVLVEETSLARRPGLDTVVLAARLRSRLAAAGIPWHGREEKVRIVLDAPVPARGPTVPFGVTAGLVNPATGYSLATSLRLAPVVADALAENLGRGPGAAVKAAHRCLWTPSARAVHLLRRHGLRALRGMPPSAIPSFFDRFFALPEPSQRAFTSGREDVAGTTAAMTELFRDAPWAVRRRLVLPALPPARRR
ncbi:lycopene cyclase family protein [Amycolatopsis sp. H20-H5]|uniref:lycopene cyclase family protein n=1 Tax=Amycolatopsis sp. H20-H5 TaxID=3046309 RepID=UPI002DBB9B72|nr:lycopene cyclase family protein [Amycolatopsis sp. H20-H5]MEC3976631.1 lycopene cyclase family protein [Amycolatopsis sp. H20-H5]